MTKKQKILFLLIFLLGSLILYFREFLSYGIAQGIGQMGIVWNARPVSEVLLDSQVADSIKQKLKFVQKVRQYAIDSLGLNDSDNYKTFYDQQGQEILWVVTACQPFELREKVWEFPIVGIVPYKGFFSFEKAKAEARMWKDEGLDVSIRNPGGWSTLGWFTDPILSGMLSKSSGDLASLIIHEMVHATIYVQDSSTFNENLASFIGDEGARKFLLDSFGAESLELKEFDRENYDYQSWIKHVLRGADSLRILYSSNSFKVLTDSLKNQRKYELIRRIASRADTLNLESFPSAQTIFKDKLPNNTYFMTYIRYQTMQPDFSRIYQEKFNSEILEMIRYYCKSFPFL